MIKYFPVAIVSPKFKWMANFWSYMQYRVYGSAAQTNSLLLITKQNRLDDPIYNDIDWDIKNIPYQMVEGIWKYVDHDNNNCIVINVFSAVKQVIHRYNDDEVICITDMDVIPMRPYDGPLPRHNEVIAYHGYEDWHMHIADPSKKNYKRIEYLLKHKGRGYMNGGFVPIFMTVKTFKKIIDDVISIAETIIKSDETQDWRWWSCMTALSIACHNNKVRMLNSDNTYIPNFNELAPHHLFTHYSVDPIFNKNTFPNHNIKEYPNNGFYNFVRDWIVNL